MLFIRFFLAISLFCALPAGAQNKIIYLIAPPRSSSTAFVRMMEARKDFAVFNEPSQRAWHLSVGHRSTADLYKEHPKTFEQVKQRIYKQAENAPVFVKEMSYAVHKFLLEDQEFITNPQVYFVFLIRNPHDVIISYYKRWGDKLNNKELDFSTNIGFRASYELYRHLIQYGTRRPHIICAEDIYNNPDGAIQEYCFYVGIAHAPASLHWPVLDSSTNKNEWGVLEQANPAWHDEVLHSSGFGRPAKNAVDEFGLPTWDAVQSQHRAFCQEVYQAHLRYYSFMLQEKEMSSVL